MDIRITKKDADYLWYALEIKENALDSNTDEMWDMKGGFCQYYSYEDIVIKAVFEVLDHNAPMDSSEFCDWDNPDALYVVSDMSSR